MIIYTLKQVLNKDIVILNSSEYGSQIWQTCRLRKDNICEQTGINLKVGSKAFRPITNGYNRMYRISIEAMNGICKLK